jgi:hypothetical protein
MQPPSYEEYLRQHSKTAVREPKKEEFQIQTCPTPGCKAREVTPTINNGAITGFTCTGGCRYSARRNQLTGTIDYYQLMAFNHYRVDPGVAGFKVTPLGTRHIDWY